MERGLQPVKTFLSLSNSRFNGLKPALRTLFPKLFALSTQTPRSFDSMFPRFPLFLCLLWLIQPARAAVSWPAERGDFAFCLLQTSSGFWVGTEDNGLWRRDAKGDWRNFTTQNGLGENAVRCLLRRGDQIWAGHARAGLSVWDGATWHRIGIDQGLPSGRVNDLALDDQSGDVWVATEGGLCRWNDEGGWTMPDSPLTRQQIVALACARGNIWAATACEGLLRSSDRGRTWSEIRGAPIQPITATGAGLPSDVINDVAVDELGQVWVATDLGLARSGDEGQSWFFVRGADWRANVSGDALKLAPRGDEARVEAPGEDWVQTLAPDGDGHIWLGFREQGAEMRDIQSAELVFATRFAPGRVVGPGNAYVRAIYPLPNNRAILARYGGGVESVLDADFPAPMLKADSPKIAVPGAFALSKPAAIAPAANGKTAANREGALWRMDYQTRGDWVGRYGESLAWVYELPWQREFERDPRAHLDLKLGPHLQDGAGGPYTYIAFLRSENPDVLYNPAIGTRRMDEINDGTWQHQTYPFSWDGPGLWVSVEVPAGAHRASLYFYNNDGHNGLNRYRDYVLQLKPFSPAIADAEAAPDLARCRVSDFEGGVYASFAVKGPGKYWIKVGRHRSFATKFSGIFLDRIGDVAAPSETQIPRPSMRGVFYETEKTPAPTGAESADLSQARAAWQKLDEAAARGEVAPGDWQKRHQLLRAAQQAGADEALLANWRWKLGVWQPVDREQFAVTMAQIEAKRAAEVAPKAATIAP